jgi:beta-lactamase superfamily II metal-dependent hydrolase
MNGVNFHFLGVGHGDCTIIHWPERTCGEKQKDERIAMIDLYHDTNRNDYEDVIQYYRANFQDSNGNPKPIWRFICSHPHQDHICGLKELFDNSGIEILHFWDVDNKFEPEDTDGHATHKEDWGKYQGIRAGGDKKPKLINVIRGNVENYWNEDKITILSPSQEMIDDVHSSKKDGTKRKPHEIDIDHISFALLVEVNSTKVVLGGDGKEEAWNDIYENCKVDITNCHVLKAAHHGHQSGFHEDAVKQMKPQYVIFSNSKDEDENNGAYADYKRILPNAKIFKTWQDGTIIVDCGFDGNIEITNPSGQKLN